MTWGLWGMTMPNTVKLYTKPNCPQCHMTKRALEKHEIPYETIDVSQDPDSLEYVRGLGYSAAPVVVVNDDHHWSGFRPESIAGLKELV